METHNPAHPGEVLKESYLPAGLSVGEAAKRLGVSRQALSAILNGRAGISAEMAMRLSKALGTSPDLWLGMQMQYDLWQVKQKPPKGTAKGVSGTTPNAWRSCSSSTGNTRVFCQPMGCQQRSGNRQRNARRSGQAGWRMALRLAFRH
jgi:addiction module HigA family antidote